MKQQRFYSNYKRNLKKGIEGGDKICLRIAEISATECISFQRSISKKLKNVEMPFAIIITAAMAYDYKPLMKEWRDKMTPTLVKLIDMGMNYNALDLIRAEDQRQKIEKTIYQYFKNYDILITPTTAVPAFELGKMFPPIINGKLVNPVTWHAFALPFNMSWNPAASIPCGWNSEGLPIGMHIIGRKLDEKTVLQVSQAFEDIAPWQDKKPNFN